MDAKVAAISVKEKVAKIKEIVGRNVFDEWAMIHIEENQWKVLAYQTVRTDGFKTNFKSDVSSLKSIDPSTTQIGEFAFSNDGYGTKFDAYLYAGNNIFFLFNHTAKTAAEITSDPSWEKAEKQLEELRIQFVMDPVECAT